MTYGATCKQWNRPFPLASLFLNPGEEGRIADGVGFDLNLGKKSLAKLIVEFLLSETKFSSENPAKLIFKVRSAAHRVEGVSARCTAEQARKCDSINSCQDVES